MQSAQLSNPVVRPLTSYSIWREEKLKGDKIIIHEAGKAGVIAIPTRHKLELIIVADILFAKADSNYTRIFIKGRRPVYVAKTLKEIGLSLVKNGFIRVHQSFLLNPSQIERYDSSLRVLKLIDGQTIPVSRANHKWVCQRLLNWT